MFSRSASSVPPCSMCTPRTPPGRLSASAARSASWDRHPECDTVAKGLPALRHQGEILLRRWPIIARLPIVPLPRSGRPPPQRMPRRHPALGQRARDFTDERLHIAIVVATVRHRVDAIRRGLEPRVRLARRPRIFPARSIETSSFASRISPITYARPCLSKSLYATGSRRRTSSSELRQRRDSLVDPVAIHARRAALRAASTPRERGRRQTPVAECERTHGARQPAGEVASIHVREGRGEKGDGIREMGITA